MNKVFANLLSFYIPHKNIRQMFRNFLLSKQVSIKGKNNQIVLIKDGVEHKVRRFLGCRIKIRGNDNVIKLHWPIKFYDSNIIIEKSNNCLVEIGTSRGIRNSKFYLHKCNEAVLSIGDDTTIRGADIFMREKTKISIGKDCMLSSDIVIRSVDAHTIIDTKSNKIVNYADESRTLSIGDHCWIGQRVFITKNAKIPDNTIVGACSLVTKEFTSNYTIIGGTPAKVIKTDRDWRRKIPSELNDI